MRRTQRLGGLLVAGLLALTGCAGAAEPEATAGPSPVGFTNPVYDGNFPDPMIVADPDGEFWAVATNGNGSNVQTLRSADLTSWEQGPDALPELPDWTDPGKVWAPEVEEAAGNRYLLYYTSIGPNPAIQCVGVAAGQQPEGPTLTEATGHWSARRIRAAPSTPTPSPRPRGSGTSTGRTTATRSEWIPSSPWPSSTAVAASC